MRIRPILSAAALAALALPWTLPLSAQNTLRLMAVEGGVGILRPRSAGECFVVVPRHVTESVGSDTLWAIPAPGTREALNLVQERYSADLALWRVTRRVDRTACPAWPTAADVNQALQRADRRGTEGMLTPWTPDGPGLRVAVRVDALTRTSFGIAPLNGQRLREGMSGSPVYVNGMLVGIATEIVVEEDTSYGVAMRLDYVEDHLGRFFHPGRPPNDPLIIASLVAPGLGQMRTRRPAAGILWAGMAAGPSLFAVFASENEQVPRTRLLPDGREETYYESRTVNPYRELAWIPWAVAGLGSFLEARAHAGRHYIPPERSEARVRRRASLRVEPSIRPEAGGGTRVNVAEIRF